MNGKIGFVLVAALTAVLVSACSDSTEPEEPKPTGTISVQPPASEPFASTTWTLDGPAKARVTGTGPQTLEDQRTGTYVLTWGDAAGWLTPDAETAVLEEDSTLVFTCDYALDTSATTIAITVEPADLEAPWTLTGPSGYTLQGEGSDEVVGLAPGDYTIEWDDVFCREAPAAETLTLDVPRIEFAGTYTVDPVFPGSPQQLVLNFADVHDHRDYDCYETMIDEDFRIFLTQETIMDYGLPTPFFDRDTDRQITANMFSGEEPGSGVGAITDIQVFILVQLGVWEPTADPNFPGALEALYDVQFGITRTGTGGVEYLEVWGQIKFLAVSETVEHEGVMRDRYTMVGQIDHTDPTAKAIEDISWGSLKAQYR